MMIKVHENDRSSEFAPENNPVVIDSKALFRNTNEVLIVHQGTEYRLRITRYGKLILNK